MLKKIFILIAGVLIFAPQAVYAVDTAATANPDTIRSSVKTEVQLLQQQRQDAKSELTAKLQAFKQQIQTIRDAKKKQIVLRIDNRIATSNATLTTKMANSLEKMSTFLGQIKTKAAAQKTAGKDTTRLDTAIVTAQQMITAAQAAVNAQREKTYSALIPDDTLLKGNIGQMVSGFRLDIMATHKTVVDAKQAVMQTVSELAKLSGVGELNASKSAEIKE